MKVINKCEVCGSVDLEEVLDLGLHPMCDDLVEQGDKRICKEYPIVILYCKKCKTAHQKYQIPKDELFPQTYHYRSCHTKDVLEGMKNLVTSCEKEFGDLTGKKVVDVGCNDGSLLDFFRASEAQTYGIEPTGAWEDAAKKKHIIVHGYMEIGLAQDFVKLHGHPDFVTFTNVFAHIDDLHGLVGALKIMCGPKTIIVIENHYLGAIIDRNQFDTFYHEHPRTYSYHSFVEIAKSLGMNVRRVQFPSRYGGNIRVLLEPKIYSDEVKLDTEAADAEQGFDIRIKDLASSVEKWKGRKSEEIRKSVAEHGPLIAKAFPGRSAIPVKLLGLDSNEISAVYEKPLSIKVGHYVPGTRIPIVSDETMLKDLKPGAPILNLAWHISAEIRSYMKSRGFEGELLDIISDADFE